MANALMEALGLVGDVLDTPGAMVRDSLAGQNPFANIFNPSQRTSGRKLLENWGLVDQKQGEGFDAGDLGGMATSALLDPLMYLGGAGIARLAKGSRAGKVAAEALPAAKAVLPAAEESLPASELLQRLGVGPMPPALPKPTPTFYSRLERAIAEDPGKQFKTQGLLERLQGGKIGSQGGINPEEIKFTGLPGLLEGKQTIGKDELLEHLRSNGLQVGTKVRPTGPVPADWANPAQAREALDSTARYGNYQTPGGQNYKETLLRLPLATDAGLEKELTPLGLSPRTASFNDVMQAGGSHELATRQAKYIQQAFGKEYVSPHFDEPNIIAHLRTNERVLPSGERALHAEELQSDWHQAGRERHYLTPEIQANANLQSELMQKYKALDKEIDRLWRANGEKSNRTIDAMVAQYQQLGKQAHDLNAPGPLDRMVPDAPFKNTWQDLGLKQLLHDAAAGGFDRATWNTGEQVQSLVGGKLSGQQQFYDRVLPERANKLLKALGGGAVEDVPSDYKPVIDGFSAPAGSLHGIRITPELRKRILKGMPLMATPPLLAALQNGGEG